MALYYWPLPLSREASRWITTSTRKKSTSSSTDTPEDKKTLDTTAAGSYLVDDQDEDSLALSLTLSAIAFVLRPTNIVIWSFLGLELCTRSWKVSHSAGHILKLVTKAFVIG
jgi:hypothetical protein